MNNPAFKSTETLQQLQEGFVPPNNVNSYNNNNNPKSDIARATFLNVPHLTEKEAKESLAQYVSEHCCYGDGVVSNMIFDKILSTNTHRYVLETFTEQRSIDEVYEPYNGAAIFKDGHMPPGLWDIKVSPLKLFEDQVHKTEIPNTAEVRNCDKCHGSGKTKCSSCRGTGRESCIRCRGDGKLNDNTPCSSCRSTGYERCNSCNQGQVSCRRCHGSGRLKWFRQLVVTFKNNIDDYFKKYDVIPEKLVRSCQPHTVFTEQDTRVNPINSYSEEEINQASRDLLLKHASFSSNGKILGQRQHIYLIPVSLCSYTLEGNTHTFHVYGIDHKVYAPDYPQKCCWGCNII